MKPTRSHDDWACRLRRIFWISVYNTFGLLLLYKLLWICGNLDEMIRVISKILGALILIIGWLWIVYLMLRAWMSRFWISLPLYFLLHGGLVLLSDASAEVIK